MYYDIDARGRHTRERIRDTNTNHILRDERLSYNTLGWLTSTSDNQVSQTTQYDAAGNKLRVISTSVNDAGASTTQTRDYAYDAMNRVTVSDGKYIAASNQVEIHNDYGTRLTYGPLGNGNGNGNGAGGYVLYNEVYKYTATGLMLSTTRNVAKLWERTYDLAGREAVMREYDASGVTVNKPPAIATAIWKRKL